MFDFLGLETRRPEIALDGHRNKSLGYSAVIRPEHEQKLNEVLAALPDRYLEIFQREPYNLFPWRGLLARTPAVTRA
jgi:hypothetical protein